MNRQLTMRPNPIAKFHESRSCMTGTPLAGEVVDRDVGEADDQ